MIRLCPDVNGDVTGPSYSRESAAEMGGGERRTDATDEDDGDAPPVLTTVAGISISREA
jgi:hypothetical protein